MKLATLLVCPLLFIGPNAAAEGSIQWGQVQFDELRGTVHEHSIREVVFRLKDRPASAYVDQFANGKTWGCIVQILGGLAWVDAKMEREDLSADPAGQGYEYYRSHSGHRWAFWHQLALLGQVAFEAELTQVLAPSVRDVFGEESGLRDVLDPALRDVLEQMERAFKPLLNPGPSESH